MRKRKKSGLLWRGIAVALSLALLCTMAGCKKAPKRVTNEIEKTVLGIDVARYQGTIDWKQVADSGVEFAMVRLGFRSQTDGQIKEDVNARYNLQEAGRAGIPVGAYFFSTAVSSEEAMEEAAWCAEFVEKYAITYPIVYDCEGYSDPDSRQYGLTKEERTDFALDFLKTIETLGYEGMFYASRNEMHNDKAWEVSRIEDDYKIWVAQYPDAPYPTTAESSYSGTHQMWQYSMEGSVPGIGQPVDLNVAYFAYDGIEPAKNSEPPSEASPDVAAMLTFDEVEEQVTAKDEVRLRDRPSQDEDSQVLYTLKNGDTARRIAVSTNGWSKVIYDNMVCYAVSSYLTADLDYDPDNAVSPGSDEQIKTQFMDVNELVTAKEKVNLRKLPSTEHPDAVVLAELYNGDIATRVGVSDNGWSKLIYNGVTCYGVSSYMTKVDADFIEEQADSAAEVGMEFDAVMETVKTTKTVNLRTLPSTERSDSKVIVKLEAGQTLTRTGVNEALEWSRVVYKGQVLYCVSWYLEEV